MFCFWHLADNFVRARICPLLEYQRTLAAQTKEAAN
jgi:hypothetical protein